MLPSFSLSPFITATALIQAQAHYAARLLFQVKQLKSVAADLYTEV